MPLETLAIKYIKVWLQIHVNKSEVFATREKRILIWAFQALKNPLLWDELKLYIHIKNPIF